MIKTIKCINILLLSLLCLTCKKKTTTTILVYNYALAEPIANAKVVLVEKKGEGSDASCNIITSAITDADGKCVFDQEKLRTSSNYSYYCAISEAYNTPQNYPCAGKTSGYLDVGKPNSQMLNVSIFGAYLKVQYNNLLNPSQSGDSNELPRGRAPRYRRKIICSFIFENPSFSNFPLNPEAEPRGIL